MIVHPVFVDLVGPDPGHTVGVGARHRLAVSGRTDEVDNHKVVADLSLVVPVDAIEGFDDRADGDVEAGLFLDLPSHGVLQGLAELEQPAWQRPLAPARLMRALDDQRLAVADDHRANADDGMRGVFSGHMKSHTEYLTFNIPARMGFENITPKVDAAVRKSGVTEGLVLVNAMHITASVFINDDERGLHKDYAKWLETLAPFDASPERYAHNRTGEDNADAHMKRQIMGREVVVAITKGQLDFGPWEQIFYGEFDGKRNKRVLIKIIGE
jgi:secondary thiamine-phosphate synthase enzyme